MDVEKARTMAQRRQRLVAFIRTKIKWFVRIPIGLILVYAFLNPFVPEIAENISTFLKFSKPSLVAIIAVIILLIILERIIIIEDELVGARASSLRTYPRRDEAYNALSRYLSSRKARKVDLLQFSGATAHEVLRTLANHSPLAEVRILLFDPDVADQFDTDMEDHHAQRIKGTINTIKLLHKDFAENGFRVNVRHYTANPSVAAVIVDHNMVSVSWYRTFLEKDVMRLEGHNSATITGSGESAAPLLYFAQNQFETLWNMSEEV